MKMPIQSTGIADRAIAANEPWPSGGPAQQPIEWEAFAQYSNVLEGHIVAGQLENEGVPVVLLTQWVGPDLNGYAVIYVPKQLAHRARWVLSWDPPDEEELAILATTGY